MNRKFGVSKRPSVISGSEKVKSQEKSPPKKELQKSTPKIAKEYIDTRWPKVKIFYAMKSFIQIWPIIQNMFDNMSGFWRMQCAEEDFRITPKNYSLYLDPEQRDKELKITWVFGEFLISILQ